MRHFLFKPLLLTLSAISKGDGQAIKRFSKKTYQKYHLDAVYLMGFVSFRVRSLKCLELIAFVFISTGERSFGPIRGIGFLLTNQRQEQFVMRLREREELTYKTSIRVASSNFYRPPVRQILHNLASDWSKLITWPEYWPLIGQLDQNVRGVDRNQSDHFIDPHSQVLSNSGKYLHLERG